LFPPKILTWEFNPVYLVFIPLYDQRSLRQRLTLWLVDHFLTSGVFVMPVVRVSWFEGKNQEQKAKVAAEITESIVRHTGTDANYIYVIFEDVKASDWAGGGKLFGEPSPTA
jgi:4-oxalocrotonate tautomerase